MRPLGLLVVWKVSDTDPKWQIMKQGLFGYYQNGVDYLTQFAQVKGWKQVESITSDRITFEVGPYLIELSLIQATGVDLSKETYLFEENVNDEKETTDQASTLSTPTIPSGDSGV